MQQEQTQLEEMRTTEEQNDAQGGGTYLVDAMKKQKENSVPKKDYDKLLAENKALVEAYTEGKLLDGDTVEVKQEKRKASEIRDELFGSEHNNLDGWRLTLELREAVLEETGKDIFVPEGHEYNPTDMDYEKAQNVADVVSECIKQSNGSSEDFTAFLMSKTNDIKLPTRNRR